MSSLIIRYEVNGLGINHLLKRLQKNEIPIAQAIYRSDKSLLLSLPLSHAESAEKLFSDLGFRYCKLDPQGKERSFAHVIKHRSSMIILLLVLFFVSLSMQYIWEIDYASAGQYTGEIRTYLLEKRITPGVIKNTIDIKQIETDLLQRFPHIAWIHVYMRGQTLIINLTQGVQVPADPYENKIGNIVALYDGVVEAIHVYAGKAAVAPGDTVRAGDVLIYGQERSKDGQLVSVHANGSVILRTWKKATAAIPMVQYSSKRTGLQQSQRVITIPGCSLAWENDPDYLQSETETARCIIGGAWIPVWLEKRIHYEITLEEQLRNETDTKAEAGTLAMRNLLQICGENDEIVDKFLDYSMIEGENMIATATAELLMDGGQFQPLSSN